MSAQTESGTVVESPEECAARLGVSIEFARMHQGRHVCVDGKHYNVSCLLSDPDCDHIARYYMKRAATHERRRDDEREEAGDE